VTGETRLSDIQRRRAARIALEKGLTCPDCGSSEPVPKDEVRSHPGGADVAMRCEDCENATEMTLVLSPEEAKALGLHALRDLP
jgi:transcription elongation factor Elf1